MATPAPWTVTVYDKQTVYVHGGPDNDAIADFSFADQHTVSISKDEAVANATLCAAAPDLLSASQAVIAAWYSAASSDDVTFDPLIALIALRAAISKATTVAP
jgi:hypothetical protein